MTPPATIAEQAPALSAQDLGKRVLALIESLRDTRGLAPENIEKVTGMPIRVNPEDPNDYGVSGKLTDAQKTFLTTQLERLDTAKLAVVNVTANNGALAKQVEATTASNAAQVTMLDGLVSKRTDADLAQAAVDLNLSEVAIQASAQVISRLSEVSLLNFLR